MAIELQPEGELSMLDGIGIYYGVGFLIYCIVCGLITKYINESKGYINGFAWGAWLGIIGILIVLCKPSRGKNADEDMTIEKGKPIDTLERLSSLHERGVLTDQEFESKKQELLRKI